MSKILETELEEILRGYLQREHPKDENIERMEKLTEMYVKLRTISNDEGSKKKENLATFIEKYGGIATNTLSIVLPTVLYFWWVKKGFQFEETGSITSNSFKNLGSNIRPGKRM